MGFSTTATHIILFIASIVIATSLILGVSNAVDSLKHGIEERAIDVSRELRTGIAIVHVNPGADTVIYVEGTGSTTLSGGDVGLIIDDVWVSETSYNVSVVNRTTNINNSLWDPKEIIKINYTTSLSLGRHKAKVTVRGGVSDEYSFDR